MFPMFFHWPNSAFLPAYAGFAALLAFGYRRWLHWRNRPFAEPPRSLPLLADPYALACLRGGAPEVVRTAVFVLLYRGLLHKLVKKDLQRVRGGDETGLRPLERQVLTHFDSPRSAQGLLWESALLAQINDLYGERLRWAGMFDRRGAWERRVYWCLVALLFGVAGIRVLVTIQTPDSGFPLAIVAALLAWFLFTPVKRLHTPLGRRALAEQEVVHQRYQRRAGSVDEATWAAATFGVAALSVTAYPMAMYAMPMMRTQRAADGGDSGSSASGGGGGDTSSSSDSGWCGSDSGGSDGGDGGDGGSCGDGGGGDGGGGSSD